MLPDDWYEQLVAAYPKREGGGAGRKIITRLVNSAINNGAQWDRILLGAQNYNRFCGRKGMIRSEFVLMLQTFVGRDWHFEEWADMDLRTPQQIADDTRWRNLEDRARALGFQTVDRVRGYSVALSAIEQAERSADIGVARSLKLVR